MDILDVLLVDRCGRELPTSANNNVKVEIQQAGDEEWRVPDTFQKSRAIFKLKPPPMMPLPATGYPIPIFIRIVPSNESLYWGIEATIMYEQGGRVQVFPDYDPYEEEDAEEGFVSKRDAVNLFHSGEGTQFGFVSGDSVGTVRVIMSKVRNVLLSVKRTLEDSSNVPSERKGKLSDDKFTIPEENLPLKWSLDARQEMSVAGRPLAKCVGNGACAKWDIQASSDFVAPDMEEAVLELKSGIPRLLCVSCPRTLLAGAKHGGALPFLFHFRPYARGAGYFNLRRGSQGYPWDWDYLFFCLWADRSYLDVDTLKRPKVGKGRCYQITASRKLVASVLPVPYQSDFGNAENPTWLDDLFVEIQAYMLRRNAIYWPSEQPSRVAVSGHSAGNEALGNLIEKADTGSAIREVYLFDPPDSTTSEILDKIVAWETRLGADDCRVRAYARYSHHAYTSRKFVEITQWETDNPTTMPSDTPLLAFANMDVMRWETLMNSRGNPKMFNSGNMHQLIGSMMLTDALRRSAF